MQLCTSCSYSYGGDTGVFKPYIWQILTYFGMVSIRTGSPFWESSGTYRHAQISLSPTPFPSRMWNCLAISTQSTLDDCIMVNKHGRKYLLNIFSGDVCSKLAFFNKSEDRVVVCPFSRNRYYIYYSNKLRRITYSTRFPYAGHGLQTYM